MKSIEYIAYLHKDSDSDFGVSFPDFPGCVTTGKTLDEARRLAPEALALHIEGMKEDGERIPRASTLDDLVSDPDRKGAVAILVSVEPSQDRIIRVNLTARESQLRKIEPQPENCA
ncbi:MAG TPA: type II toxin-antitoxin system HicB family antitoxin [Bryobacteraceae bacterium]|nr:type II toxin-antitoxin system HicB family antitoxin [Bryobacteraceae bacterium]